MQSQPLTYSLTRPESGRSTEAATNARRLEVLQMVSEGTPRAVIKKYIAQLGFSEATAREDMEWARAAWRAQDTNDDTVADLIRLHKERYYELAFAARQQGDPKLEAEMLGRAEKLMGLHGPKVAVQINNTHNTAIAVSYDLSKLDANRLDQLRHLLEAAKTDADAT